MNSESPTQPMSSPHEERADSKPVTLWVNEIFGPTIQGEGVSIGADATFLRLAFCAVGCAWCDTAYTWDFDRFDRASEVHPMTPEQAVEAVSARLPSRYKPLVIISGGEPLGQVAALVPVVRRLRDVGCRVEIETSGTIAAGPLANMVDLFTVSPKLAHSGVAEHRRLRWSVLENFAVLPNAAFKFVVRVLADLQEVDEIVRRLALTSVMVMPLGTNVTALDAVTSELSDEVASRDWVWTDRLHIRRWGDERGR